MNTNSIMNATNCAATRIASSLLWPLITLIQTGISVIKASVALPHRHICAYACLMLIPGQVAFAQAQDLRILLMAAVEGHPTVLARKLDIGASSAEVQGARWQYWPTPSLAVQQLNQAPLGTDRAVQQISVKQPLWTGGRLESQLSLAQARERAASAALQEAQRDIVLTPTEN